MEKCNKKLDNDWIKGCCNKTKIEFTIFNEAIWFKDQLLNLMWLKHTRLLVLLKTGMRSTFYISEEGTQ